MLSEYYQVLKLQIYSVNEHHKIQYIDSFHSFKTNHIPKYEKSQEKIGHTSHPEQHCGQTNKRPSDEHLHDRRRTHTRPAPLTRCAPAVNIQGDFFTGSAQNVGDGKIRTKKVKVWECHRNFHFFSRDFAISNT